MMNLQIAKWGNSLALRIPADYVRSIGIKEGETITSLDPEYVIQEQDKILLAGHNKNLEKITKL